VHQTTWVGHTCRALATVAVIVGLGACGNDDSSSSGGGSAIGKSASSEQRNTAAVAGEKAATGAPVTLKKQTIGVLEVTGAAEIIQRSTNSVKQAAAEFGWDVKVCDAQGAAAKFTSCARTLLTGGATAILSEAVESAPMKAQMEEAQKRGIPWINLTGEVTASPLFNAQITEPEVQLSTVISDYVVEKLGGKGSLAYTTFPALYAFNIRENVLKDVLAKNPGIKIYNRHIADLANPDEGRDWATSVLTRNPKLGAFWTTVDFNVLGFAQAVQAKFPGKSFPDRPLVAGAYANLAQLDLIRKGQIDGVGEVPIEAASWIALDQLAQFFGRKTPIAKDPAGAYPFPFLEARMVTKADVPADPKQYVPPKHDFASFFTAKWKKEFTAGS
jgi:ribose transport system substrate-binding protein